MRPKQFNSMLIINIKENESIDKALKRFKKKFEKTGVLKELRRRTYFEKPSVERREEIKKAVYKIVNGFSGQKKKDKRNKSFALQLLSLT